MYGCLLNRLRIALCVTAWCGTLTTVLAQSVPHMEHAGAMPPGYIGGIRLQRGGPVNGYFQPVELRGPKGSRISLAVENQFTAAIGDTVKVGMLIAPNYRFRVTNIGRNPGGEVYPTVEVVDRLYPPQGREFDHPIVVEFTQEDLELALAGKLVTRVVYLENPQAALPQAIKEQPYFEVAPGRDPLTTADQLGRPMAILRMGGRIPDDKNGPDVKFMFGSPPLLVPQSLLETVYPHGLPTTISPAKDITTISR